MSIKRLTVNEVAGYCGVTFLVVRDWIHTGRLTASQIPGRPDYYVDLNDFLAFLHDSRMPVPPTLLATGHRVLIIDDDEMMTRMIEAKLQEAGFTTHVALDGFIGGAMLESVRPTLMTLDIRMPGLDGIGVLKFIRGKEHLRETKILIVSALEQDRIDEALQAGADDSLRKPFDPPALVAKILALAGFAPDPDEPPPLT
jgi:CheY-like chemotaxis protein